MAYCLKTGGILYDAALGCGYECDLHIEGDCVIAVTCPPDYDVEPDNNPRITLTVLDPDAFRRESKPFGVVIAEQSRCLASPGLLKHIAEWYPHQTLHFQA